MADKMIGKDIPHLQLSMIPGESIRLPEDIRGKWTLLYFYPKDDTPGCTKQACTYQENIAKFQALKVAVYGVSLDDVDSHAAFQNKFGLKFPLIADTQQKLSEALGVYGEQEWKGKKYNGLSRDTFLINPQGKIEKVWRKVDAATTVMDTYEEVKMITEKY